MSSLTNRYGSPKRGLSKRTRLMLIIGALGLSMVAAFYLAMANHSSVQFSDNSFEVLSNTQSTAIVDITKNAEDTVQCEVRAMNESYAIVGWKTLIVGPSEGKGSTTQSHNVDLRTEALATTVGIEECRILKVS